MKKAVFASAFLIALAQLTEGARASAGDLACAGSSQSQTVTFTANPSAGTITRDGRAYSIFETHSFFGYIVTPVDADKGQVDWSLRIAVPFAQLSAGTGGVLGMEGGTIQIRFACQLPPGQ